MVSPATTHCSELDYLIGLQVEELLDSPLRRSQRLQQRPASTVLASSTLPRDSNKNISAGSTAQKSSSRNTSVGSPQLFMETDEECSQFGRLPRNRVKNSEKKRCKQQKVARGPPAKRARKARSRFAHSTGNCSTSCAVQKPVLCELGTAPTKLLRTTTADPQLETVSHDVQLKIIGHRPEQETVPTEMQPGTILPQVQFETKPMGVPDTKAIYRDDWQYFCELPPIIISSGPSSSLLVTNGTQTSPPIRQRSRKRRISAAPAAAMSSKPAKTEQQMEMLPGEVYKRSRKAKDSKLAEAEPQPTTLIQAECLPAQNSSWQQSTINAAEPTLRPPLNNPKPNLNPNPTQIYSYQRIHNETQTLIPDRYPPHFIHQLPAEPTQNINEIIAVKPEQLRARSCPPTELRQICPTPDTTPTMANEMMVHSPTSNGSSTPSLSDSLAEIFGTKKIRDLLNIQAPRKYAVQESHLPFVAFMLGVELARLRTVLALTQRLTLEQLQHMGQETRDIISVPSSSDEETKY